MVFSFTTEIFYIAKSTENENQNMNILNAHENESMSNSTFQDNFAAP